MRARWSSLASFVIAVAAVAAVLSHWIIDVVADYLVAHATYDDVAGHDSRALVTAVAAVLTAVLSVRAFSLCCDAAARGERAELAGLPGWRSGIAFVVATVALASVIVPAMEFIDTTIAGTSIGSLTDAYGGSIAMGLSTTIACGLLVGAVAFAGLRWLLARCDRIVAAIAAVICHLRAAIAPDLGRVRVFNRLDRRRYHFCARRRGLRAPPHDACRYVIPSSRHYEDPHVSRIDRGVLPRGRHRPHAHGRADRGRAPQLQRA